MRAHWRLRIHPQGQEACVLAVLQGWRAQRWGSHVKGGMPVTPVPSSVWLQGYGWKGSGLARQKPVLMMQLLRDLCCMD